MTTVTKEHAVLLRDFANYTEKLWMVQPKIGNPKPFKLNNPQLICDYEMQKQRRAGKPIRQKWLKYRQGGLSTIATAVMQHAAQTREGWTSLSVADKADLPRQWMRRARTWLEQTPDGIRPETKAESALELYFNRLGSRYYIGSAEGTTPGMGYTIRGFHASEVAFWLHPQDLLDDLMPAIPIDPETIIIFESTGEMVGDYWYNSWWSSRNTDDDYCSLFLPWFIHEEYQWDAPLGDLSEKETWIMEIAMKWSIEFPQHAELINFHGVTDAQLAWRRKSLVGEPFFGDESAWACKYPSTPEEAFLAGGKNIFTPDQVALAQETVRPPIWRGNIVFPGGSPANFVLDKNESGYLLIFEHPNKDFHYVLGADCQWGEKEKADFDVLYIECLETGRICARARGHFPLAIWGKIIAAVGFHFNTCPVAPERNARAATALMPLLLGNTGDWRYPAVWIRSDDVKLRGHRPQDYGWLTTDSSKGELVQYAQQQTLLKNFDWCDAEAVHEMKSFVVRDDGTWGTPESSTETFDDCVMARMITGYVAKKERGRTDLYHAPEPAVFTFTTPQERAQQMIELAVGKDGDTDGTE